MAVEVAITPTIISLLDQSQIAAKAVPITRSMLSKWLMISIQLTNRICLFTLPKNSFIATFAKLASRPACENSLIVLILVYASVILPVIKDLASA